MYQILSESAGLFRRCDKIFWCVFSVHSVTAKEKRLLSIYSSHSIPLRLDIMRVLNMNIRPTTTTTIVIIITRSVPRSAEVVDCSFTVKHIRHVSAMISSAVNFRFIVTQCYQQLSANLKDLHLPTEVKLNYKYIQYWSINHNVDILAKRVKPVCWGSCTERTFQSSCAAGTAAATAEARQK